MSEERSWDEAGGTKLASRDFPEDGRADKGQQCLGNPGTGTPTLAYGTQTGVGPFRCKSASTGITCVAGGKGFRISTSGVRPVPA